LGDFAKSAAILLLKDKHYFTLSFIFSSAGDVSFTAIAASATKNTDPSSCLPPPSATCIFVVQIQDALGVKGDSDLFKNGTKFRTAESVLFLVITVKQMTHKVSLK
jgi:hypothetical protein